MRPANPPLRVLFLSDLLEMGGAETQLVELARSIDVREIELDVALLRGGGALSERLPAPPHVLPRSGPLDPRPLLALAQLVRARGVSVVMTTHVWSLLYASALRVLLGAKAPAVVATVHSYRRPATSGLLEPLWTHAVRHADRIVAVSHAQAEWLVTERGVARGRLIVLPNAIESARFADLAALPVARATARPREILCVARLVEEKDHATLLEAFRRLLAAGRENLTLTLVGDGPLRRALSEQARTIERELAHGAELVRFVGMVDDVRPWLARADLVVLASRHESQGIALVEAMAGARPVVATNVGGIPELVEDEVTGLLVPPRDPARLAAAIARLLDDSILAARLGAAGRARVEERFSLSARVRALTELFRQVAAAAAEDRSHRFG